MGRLYRYAFVLLVAAGTLVSLSTEVSARFRLLGRRNSCRASSTAANQILLPASPTLENPPPPVGAIENPSPSDKPLAKPETMLPEDVTKITKEDLLQKTPNFFAYDYNFDPEPGKRYWLRISDDYFLERYPSGTETRFDIFGRGKMEEIAGTVVARVAADGKHDGFQVFISDRTLEDHSLYFRLPSVNEGKWVLLGKMKSVE